MKTKFFQEHGLLRIFFSYFKPHRKLFIIDMVCALLIFALCMPINSFANATYFTLRSGGKTLITFFFDSFFVCVFTVPLALLLTYATGISIVPLFLITQLVDIFKCVIGGIMIKKGVWIHNIVEEH